MICAEAYLIRKKAESTINYARNADGSVAIN